MLLYDNMRFDLLLVSDHYEYQAQPGVFPLTRARAGCASAPDVAAATPLYFGVAKWKGGEGGVWPDLFVIGFDPARPLPPRQHQPAIPGAGAARYGARRQQTRARSSARSTTGRVVEIGNRQGDDRRPIPARHRVYGHRRRDRSARQISSACSRSGASAKSISALIRLKPGVDPVSTPRHSCAKLAAPARRSSPAQSCARRETSYWTTRTSVGLIFGSGLLISIVVGIMVVYQIVSTQVSRQLPQFATLKAIGYGDRALAVTVAAMSLMIVVAGFAPALAAATWRYRLIRETHLAAGDDVGRTTPRPCSVRRSRWRRSRRCWRSAACGAPIPPTCFEQGPPTVAIASLRPRRAGWSLAQSRSPGATSSRTSAGCCGPAPASASRCC